MFSTAGLPVTEARSEDAAPSTCDALRLEELSGAARGEIERFIAARFRDVYGAQVHHFMPRLFGLREADGALIAAFGLRNAASGPLFLEQYLDAAVEQIVARQFGACASRDEIVEVGNLAGATPGALRLLIPSLTQSLQREGTRWIAFTGAAQLCKGFTRLGLPLHLIATANPQRLPEHERALWGSYYHRAPAVMLGDVDLGYRKLHRLSRSPASLDARLAPLARIGVP